MAKSTHSCLVSVPLSHSLIVSGAAAVVAVLAAGAGAGALLLVPVEPQADTVSAATRAKPIVLLFT
jgi:hypothetical protein